VLTLDGERIARLHGFVRPDLFALFDLPARLSQSVEKSLPLSTLQRRIL
jgi:hypothetical protein